MTGNSLQSLLAWLKDDSRINEWDALMVVSVARVNQGLQQEYAKRLSRGEAWQVPALQVPVPETPFTHHLDGMLLGAPLFALTRPSLESPATQYRVPLQGGSDMLVGRAFGVNQIVRLTSWDPLNSPGLLLELRPAGSHGLLQVDVAEAEEVLLEFDGTPLEQQEIGKQFLAWFQDLPAERRAWPVLDLAGANNPMLQGGEIALRSQASPGGGPDSALLLFISMEHGQRGGFPSSGSGFKYLLPDDSDRDYSATLLFSSDLLHRAALAGAVQGMVEQGQFAYQPDTGLARKMVASGGTVQVPATRLHSDDLELDSQAFTLQAASNEQPLWVTFAATEARQTWQFTCEVPLRYRPRGGTDWQSHTARFRVKVDFEFHLAADDSARLGMQGHLFVPYGLTEEAVHLSGLPTLPGDQLQQLQGLVAIAVKRALLEHYTRTLRIDTYEQVLASADITGVLGFAPGVQALPHDLALFGSLADSGPAWHIAEHSALIEAGQSLQLRTDPALEGLDWDVQNLPDSGGDAGRIDANGLYQSPPAHALGGPLRRVLISASDPASGDWRFTLLTISSRTVSVAPLIQVCGAGDVVNLSAGQVGDGVLRWAVGNPVSGESGTLQPDASGRTCKYTAAPAVAGKAYVLDEIRVSDQSGSRTQSVWVLVRQREPVGELRPDFDADTAQGQLQLQVLISGNPQTVDWRLAADSPGDINEQGLYSSDPAAAQPFALIFAQGSRLGSSYELHIILPLPLSQYPSVMQALAQPTLNG